jgi:hypothetical protein
MKTSIIFCVLICLGISCSSGQDKTNQASIIIHKLAYIAQIALSSPGEINQEMRTFISSEEYLKIKDPVVSMYVKKAFVSIQEALNQEGMNQGFLLAQAQHNLVLAGEQLKLPECDAFSKAVGSNKTIEAIKAASKLAESGKVYWK